MKLKILFGGGWRIVFVLYMLKYVFEGENKLCYVVYLFWFEEEYYKSFNLNYKFLENYKIMIREKENINKKGGGKKKKKKKNVIWRIDNWFVCWYVNVIVDSEFMCKIFYLLVLMLVFVVVLGY